MEDAYSGYKYTRYRPRRKGRHLFLFVVIPIFLAIIFFVCNIIFGFINLGKTKTASVNCPSLSFFVTQVEGYQNKSDAMRAGAEIKSTGGSGYLVPTENSWAVINNICHENFPGAVQYKTESVDILLADKTHADLVAGLVGTFKTTFNTLCDFRKKFEKQEITQIEIANMARVAYNNLVDLRGELEIIQAQFRYSNYTILLNYLTRQLFGLNLLWIDASANFLHILKNSASWVIYAYFDLTNTILK